MPSTPYLSTSRVQISRELETFAEEFTGDEAVGVRALARALTKPAYWIGHNAGVDGAVVVHHIGELPNGQGYNAATGEYGDLIGAGVIDPVKVTHSAVVNAASVARMLLTTEVSVVDKPEEEAQGHGHAH